MRILRFLQTVLTIVTLVGCGGAAKRDSRPAKRPWPEDLLVLRRPPTPTPTRLNSMEVAQDLAYLIYALENAYGGRAYVPFDDYQLSLFALKSLQRLKGGWETAAFCERVDFALGVIPDEHLLAKLDGRPCSEDRRERMMASGKVGGNVAARGERPWSLISIEVDGKMVPVLSITHFPTHEDPVWNGFLESVDAVLKHAPALIIDLRGNGGGDDTWGKRLAARLYGREAPPQPVEKIVRRQHPSTFALSANRTWFDMEKAAAEGKVPPSYLSTRLKDHLRQLKLASSGELPLEKTLEFEAGTARVDTEKGFTKPIRLLVDRGCGSSCESTLMSFEAHPHAKSVGEPTAGFIHFGNVGLLVLPKSGIQVQMATQYKALREGRFLERRGVMPQLVVPEGKDALEAARTDLAAALR